MLSQANTFRDVGRKPRCFFFCCEQGPPEAARYQYGILPLAEGLTELGITCYSNTDYWPLSPECSEYLFQGEQNVSQEDCDVVVLNDRWFRYGNAMPKDLFHNARKYKTVYIDCADGVFTRTFKPEWRAFDHIFRAHYNQRVFGMPRNVKPWAFGLPKRIITATQKEKRWENRTDVLLSNFRTEHPLRKKAAEVLYPLLEDVFEIDDSTDGFAPPDKPDALFEWEKTGRRHNPAYYQKLKQSKAISCFGGRCAHRIVWPIPVRKGLKRLEHLLPQFVKTLYQWDSFRLWEAFAAGCLVFHVNLEKEGCLLPVMPKNGVHYIGVDLKNPKAMRDQILGQYSSFEKIAQNGRNWALANYSPVAIAQYFLTELGYNSGNW